MNLEERTADRALNTAASRLKHERERRGWSQSELAERIGTNQITVSRWEHGKSTPSPYYRQRLSEMFGKSLEELGFFTEKETGSEGIWRPVPIPDTPLPYSTPLFLSNVPYRRNAYFTGREDILAQVHAALGSAKAAALTQAQAINGLGGIGKTQVAIEYTYRYGSQYTAVLWVTASSQETLIAEFVMLAALLDLPEKNEQDQNIVLSAVKRWLITNSGWLLILDNIDDLRTIDDVLPKYSAGSILLTTRLQALGSLAQGITVDKMEEDEGVLFLLRRTKLLATHTPLTQAKPEYLDKAAEIVAELDALPLALDQAGAYIEETRCGLSAYLTLYRARRKELLRRRGNLPTDHPEPVAATWSLSFQQVEERLPAAADLLRLLAFLGPDAIPEEILTDGAPELGPELSSVACDPLLMNEIIRLLLGYSLIRRNAEDRSLSIHRLVQAVLKDSMSNETARNWAERAIRAINRVFPVAQPDTWKQCARCLPHALAIIPDLDAHELPIPQAADLLNKAAAYLTDHAQYTLAEQLLKKALAVSEQAGDSQHTPLALTLNDLGTLYLTRGRYSDAEPLLKRAREIRRQQLGSEHPDTASTLNNLARLYHARGKYDEAEEYFQIALKIRQSVLPPEHPDVALSLSSLAELYTTQARFDQAESLYKQALAIQEQALGRLHPDVAKTLNNLAFLYRKKGEYSGEYSKAEELYSDALDIQQQILVPDHPDIAETLNNIGRLYRAMGKYAKAEQYYRQALAIRERIFGSDHHYIGESYYSLAKVYRSLGRYDDAAKYGEEALRIQEQQLGENHPEIASTLDVLADIYQKQGKLDQARELYLRAWTIRENTSGPDHPHLAIIFNNLAEIYLAQHDYTRAKDLIDRSIQIREQKLGREHHYMAYSLTTLAAYYSKLGDSQQSEKFYREALEIRKKKLGIKHPLTNTSYQSLANFYNALGRPEEAKSLREEVASLLDQIKPEGP